MNNGYRFLKEADGYNLLEEPPDYEQALLPLRTIYPQFGVVQVWTVFGKLRRHGIFVKSMDTAESTSETANMLLGKSVSSTCKGQIR
nr:hypothetical protein CFP56_13732 [Quercus suber]